MNTLNNVNTLFLIFTDIGKKVTSNTVNQYWHNNLRHNEQNENDLKLSEILKRMNDLKDN